MQNPADDALEKLIQQFAQPMSFLRELVQNSLDAGTTQVEITVGPDLESGLLFVQVRDNGQGMDQETIDHKLTKLFSSTKENDLTKIGKFGIGFVSIFAVSPELVVLETGCDGESWRVLFKPDRSFEKRELHQRVEGTSVTLYLPKAYSNLPNLVTEARDTVVFWCKYSNTEILFNGTPINEKFGFTGAPYQFFFKEQNTDAVLTPTTDTNGFEGYYNRGLTLLEGPGSPFPGLKFKVRSPYLEHTLSRDNILQDDNYQRVMSQIQSAAHEKMPIDIFERLSVSPTEELWEAATHVLAYPGVKKAVQKFKILQGQEEKISLGSLPATPFWWPQVDRFWEAATGEKQTLFLADRGSLVHKFLRAAGIEAVLLSDNFFHYSQMEANEAEQQLLELLAARAPHLSGGFVAEFRSGIPNLYSGKLGAFLHSAKEIRGIDEIFKKRGDSVALVRGHPLIPELARLVTVQPEVALAILVRKLNLDLGNANKSESKILAQSLALLQRQGAEP